MMMLPKPFQDSCERLLGAESTRLFEALETASPTSIRFNPYKLSEQPEGRRVPWSRYGYYLDERPQFTLDPLFHGGAYYVQEPSSMFVEHVFRSVMGDDSAPLRVLDLCAAPGGKTTLLATLAGLESTVVANEVIRPRSLALADNVRRWGLGNVVVTNNDPDHFAGFRDWFDFVLVDAPCSGEGMFRKDPAARAEWSESGVALCAARQRRILQSVWPSLRPGGMLVYSTCTFNTAENEDNVRWMTDEFDCEGVDIPVDGGWGIVCGEAAGIPTFRFYPHRLDGEGFFAAVLRKADGRAHEQTPRPRKATLAALSRKAVAPVAGWVAQPDYMRFASVGDQVYGYYTAAYDSVAALAGSLNVVASGIRMGQVFGTTLRPEHPLALFHDLARHSEAGGPNDSLRKALSDAGLSPDVTPVSQPRHKGVVPDRFVTMPEVELQLSDAQDYLRKKEVDAALFDEGVNLVCYAGLPIGWAKRIGARVNNMYPKELRILNL